MRAAYRAFGYRRCSFKRVVERDRQATALRNSVKALLDIQHAQKCALLNSQQIDFGMALKTMVFCRCRFKFGVQAIGMLPAWMVSEHLFAFEAIGSKERIE